MQLTVDIGNSRNKYGIFKEDELIKSIIDLRDPGGIMMECFDQYPGIEAVIISSVNKQIDPQAFSIPERLHCIYLSHKTPIPIKNSYKSPETLGHDRIALIVASHYKFPGHNSLVIDIGTCVTFDLVNESGTYVGGIISPGIGLRFSTMHNGTARLPLIEYNKNQFPELL